MDSPPQVPYSAYKSKRHSRTVSNPYFEPNVSPPQSHRQSYASSSSHGPGSPENENIRRSVEIHDVTANSTPEPRKLNGFRSNAQSVPALPSVAFPQDPIPDNEEASHPAGSTTSTPPRIAVAVPIASSSDHSQISVETPTININGSPSEVSPSSTVNPSAVQRKSSTFRYVPRRVPSTSTPRNSSPLRPQGAHVRTLSAASSTSATSAISSSAPLTTRQFDQHTTAQRPTELRNQRSSFGGTQGMSSPLVKVVPIQPIPQLNIPDSKASQSSSAGNTPTAATASTNVVVPPPRSSSFARQPLPPPKSLTPSPAMSPATSPGSSLPSSPSAAAPTPILTPTISSSSTKTTSTATAVTPTPSMSASTFKAAYRPGFQPKGVYRPRTDDFLALRTEARAVGRVERTRLERRFEKLVELHFSPDAQELGEKGKEKIVGGRPLPRPNRRASSFFDVDLNDLRTKGAGELWRGMLESRAAAANGGKGDIRSAEQKITPWQNDADVSACPLCSASFHPITNRKHHCRLCGQIICSLPIKVPQRRVQCSLLFISDTKTGRIEEVSEGVDYGVRPRSSAGPQGKGGKDKGEGPTVEEKFLKGVRICRDCKPIMLQQQYRQQAKHVPTFARLYEALTLLEAEIEDALPQFQELMLSLSASADEVPPKEATVARKRLLDSFAEYDALAKRIRKLPCPGGPGSSQDRVQLAILTRANLFLQKNMFPLQSLPKPKKRSTLGAQTNGSGTAVSSAPVIDPDSELAHALQPLLEQEALLETFIEEATAHRKFEDAKTLKANLAEIRAEIDRVMANT